MTLFLTLLVFLLLRYATCAGLYESCKYLDDDDYTYVGYCELSSDCRHHQHLINKSMISYCDYTFVCCAPPTPQHEVAFGLGGIETYRNEFPHMALIGYDVEEDENQWRCSGSLISNVFVLSAAHCNSEFSPIIALIGATDYVKDYESSEVRSIIEIIDHPDYDFNARVHDICLYRLNASIAVTDNIKLICLPDMRFAYSSNVIATGWGATSLTSGMSQTLLKMDLQRWDRNTCDMKYNEDNQICAGSDKAIDTCSGDSGGPLQVLFKPSWNAPCSYIILGITSHGKACFERNGTTSIYTRVFSYVRWIKEIIWYGIMDCEFS